MRQRRPRRLVPHPVSWQAVRSDPFERRLDACLAADASDGATSRRSSSEYGGAADDGHGLSAANDDAATNDDVAADDGHAVAHDGHVTTDDDAAAYDDVATRHANVAKHDGHAPIATLGSSTQTPALVLSNSEQRTSITTLKPSDGAIWTVAAVAALLPMISFTIQN